MRIAIPLQKIDVLIVDSDYGIKEEPWDQVAWSREFEQAVNFVYNHNGTPRDCNFFIFLSDKQLPTALQAVLNQGLSYRLVTWSKGGYGAHVTGARFRTTTDFILIAWHGTLNN